jgi:hypothetical protein
MAQLAYRPPFGARQALLNIRKRLRDPEAGARTADALESLDCELFLQEYEQAYAELRENPEEWAEVQAERGEWDGTLMDGLKKA